MQSRSTSRSWTALQHKRYTSAWKRRTREDAIETVSWCRRLQENVRASLTANALLRVLMDASIRRFRTQKIFMRTTAAMRWINSRNGILKGQQPGIVHTSALHQISALLRSVSVALIPALLLPGIVHGNAENYREKNTKPLTGAQLDHRCSRGTHSSIRGCSPRKMASRRPVACDFVSNDTANPMTQDQATTHHIYITIPEAQNGRPYPSKPYPCSFPVIVPGSIQPSTSPIADKLRPKPNGRYLSLDKG